MICRALPLFLLLALGVEASSAQELVRGFQHARLRKLAQDMVSQRDMRLPYRRPDHIPVRSDTLAAWMATLRPESDALSAPPPPPEPFAVDSVRVVPRLGRVVFLRRYGATRWAFMQGRRRAEIDTTRTADIRARLQARFGAPTMTLAEMDSVVGRPAEEVIQFEYWMVINDSIPVMILDVNGPRDRGVVVAVDAKWREDLDGIRYGLLQPLFDEPRRAPFVDYYYNSLTGRWFASGYDGASFFHRRIERPNLALGRPSVIEYATRDADR